MAVATAGLSAVALSAGGLLSLGTPAVDAASAPVTITYPAGNLSSFDPIVWGGQILFDQGTVFEGLFGYNQKNQVVPKIAESWKSSDGGRVWTIWLRHNARWSNGAPVTAQDFYYAWMRLISPSDTTGAIWASVMQYVKNAYTYNAGGVPASQVGLKVVNNYELKITLGGPHNILGDLQLSASMPVYPPSVKAHPTDWWMPKYFVGDGPYVVSSFVTNGEVTLTKNPDYVGHSGEFNAGNVNTIDLMPLPTVPVEDYASGKLSVALVSSPADYAYVLKDYKDQLHYAAQANVIDMQWDRSPDPSPLYNVSVRQAIAMAINRSPIKDPVLNNMVGITTTAGIPGWPSSSLEHGLGYNVTEARSLLAKAGYPNGKGFPTIYLYSQTQAANPQSVATAEVIAQELKTALNIRSKIEPTNSTEQGEISYGGLVPGILPGYNIGDLGAAWDDSVYQPMEANQQVQYDGSLGPLSLVSYAATHWYFPNYDPSEVKAWGSPTDTSLGVAYASWQPIVKAAQADIAYLNAWTKKQPKAYQEDLNPPGTESLAAQLNYYTGQWKSAKTNAAKHAAWEAFWKWVGAYSTGNGDASYGLSAQVYFDQHEPHDVYLWTMWGTELANTVSNSQAYALTAKIVNGLMQQGYIVPLYYTESIFLERPGLTGVQANPWGWGNFYQLQYMMEN